VFLFCTAIVQTKFVDFGGYLMQRNILHTFCGFAAAFIVLAFVSFPVVAQSSITGEWEASIKEKSPDKIHISFERRTQNGRNQNGSSYSFSELQGLTREQVQNGKVSFRLVRDAGTIECEGTFQTERVPYFHFRPQPRFVDAIESRG
jgi:hypothetical protein